MKPLRRLGTQALAGSTSTNCHRNEESYRALPLVTLSPDAAESGVATVFARLVERLRAGWPELFQDDDASRRIRNLIAHQRVASDISYERDAWAFTRAFFFKNLYKALVVLSKFQSELRSDAPVLDVGAGAGVATIAWASLYGVPAGGFTLVDRSEAQIDIARRLLRLLQIPEAQFLVGTYPQVPGTTGMQRLFSYWFCEQPLDALKVLRSREVLAGNSLGSVVIDYPDIVSSIARHSVVCGCHVATAHELLTPIAEYRSLFNDSHFVAAASYVYCDNNT